MKISNTCCRCSTKSWCKISQSSRLHMRWMRMGCGHDQIWLVRTILVSGTWMGQIFSWNIAWPLIIWPTHLFLRDRATRKLNCERFRRLDIESCRFWQLDVDDAIGSYHQLRSLLISCLDAYVPWIAFGPESSTTRFRPRAPWKHSIISILVTLTKPNSRHATQRNKTRC